MDDRCDWLFRLAEAEATEGAGDEELKLKLVVGGIGEVEEEKEDEEGALILEADLLGVAIMESVLICSFNGVSGAITAGAMTTAEGEDNDNDDNGIRVFGVELECGEYSPVPCN